ncbi:MAG: sensor histidine kinase [Actinomycetota bacterium]
MFELPRSLAMIEDRALRTSAAALATFAALGALGTRDDNLVTWAFLAPTVAVFWLWASDRCPARLVHLVGLAAPLGLNLIESDDEVSMFIAIVTATAIAGLDAQRVYVSSVLAGYISAVVTLGVTGAIVEFGWPNWLFGFIFAWGAGVLLWRLRSTVFELGEMRALVADQAMLNERRRIARDVHDLVGHSLTVVLLHVAGARHVVRSDPDEAERALEQAEEAGRQSLAEIRRTVGLLRDDNDGAVDILPASDLHDIGELVDEFLLAGVDVVAELRGPLDLVEPAVGLAGYRIVREALTNVSRHAANSSATVTVAVDDTRCEIEIVNDETSPDATSDGRGIGLTSMRERARSVGGSLSAGPAGDGWSVRATLPLTGPRTTR